MCGRRRRLLVGRGDELPGRCWYLPRYGANVKLLTKAVKAANGDPGDGFDLDLSKAVLAPDLSRR